LVVLLYRLLNLLQQVEINEWTFFQGAWHCNFLFLSILLGRPLLVATTYDHLGGALVLARLVTLGGGTPGRHRVTTSGGAAFTTTVGVIDRVHGNTANSGAHAPPAGGASLAQRAQVVLAVGHFANGGTTLGRHLAHLAAAQTQGGVLAFPCNQLHRSTGAAGDLGALARLHLDAVDLGAHRNIAQRQTVADLDGRSLARGQLVAGLDALGGNNIATLAVVVTHQGDIGGAVGIVLGPLNHTGDAVLVALEIDNPVVLLVATAHMAGGDPTRVVAATALGLLLQQRGIGRTLVKIRVHHTDHKTAAR